MPKETETEETTLFCHTFIIGGNSIGEAGLPAPPATSMCHVISKLRLFMFNRFLVISKSINFAAQLSKWPSKNKGPTRAREVPINEPCLYRTRTRTKFSWRGKPRRLFLDRNFWRRSRGLLR